MLPTPTRFFVLVFVLFPAAGCNPLIGRVRDRHASDHHCAVKDVVFGQVEGEHFFSHGCGFTEHYRCTPQEDGTLGRKAQCTPWTDTTASVSRSTFRMESPLSVTVGYEGSSPSAKTWAWFQVHVAAEPETHPSKLFFELRARRETHVEKVREAKPNAGYTTRHVLHTALPVLEKCELQILVNGTDLSDGQSTHAIDLVQERVSVGVELEHAPSILESIRTTGALCDYRWTLTDAGKRQLADFVIRVREELSVRNPNAVPAAAPNIPATTTTL